MNYWKAVQIQLEVVNVIVLMVIKEMVKIVWVKFILSNFFILVQNINNEPK